MKRSTLSLKAILLLSFVLAGGVPFLVIGLVSGRLITADVSQGVRAKNLLIAQSLADEVTLFLEKSLSFLEQIEKTVVEEHYVLENEVDAYLKSSLETYKDFDSVEILDEAGIVRFMAPLDPNVMGINRSGQRFFSHVRQEKRAYWSPTFISLQTDKPTLTLGIPVTGGVIAGYLDLASLNAVIDKVKAGKHGYAMIMDQEGSIIAHHDRKMISERRNLKELKLDGYGQQPTEGSISYHLDGQEYLISVSSVPQTQWTVVVAVPAEEAFEPVARVRSIFVTGAALIVFMLVTIVFFSLRKAWSPLARLVSDARRLADGEYVFEEKPSGYREIDDLVGDFHKLAEAIRSREEALQEEKQFSEQILETMEDTLFVFDSKTGKPLRWNRAFREKSGYTDEEIAARKAPDDWYREGEAEKVSETTTTQLPGRHAVVELSLVTRDGTLIPTEYSTSTIEDAQRNIKLIISSGRDITERRRAEEALRKSEAQFKAMFAMASIGMVQADPETGRFKRVNQKFCEITGYSAQELLELGVRDITHPEDREKDWQLFQNVIAGQSENYRLEKRYIRKDKAVVWVNVNMTVIRDSSGQPVRSMATIEDITQRKQAEEEHRRLEDRLQRAEKMEALGTLAGGVAHDLNNVLGIVVGYSELLLDDLEESSPERSQALEILKGGQRAAAIVQDLLTLARRGVTSKKVLNLNDVVVGCQQSPEFARLLFNRSMIRIKTEYEPDVLNVVGSSVHLEKTFFNLVSNAAEAMPEGGVLTIKTANCYLDRPISGYDRVQEGDYVVLSVSDTGEGIRASDLKRIFEPFYTKKVMGRSGTGLGLAVVWGTVKDHLGYINVESEEGKGTTFTLYFPVTREDVAPEQTAVSAAEYMGNGESILVVDDVKEQRKLAGKMLTKLNYAVESVSSGEEALEYLKSNKADLLVLDMIMDPGMDGLDTYRKILEIHPRQKAIIVSGFAETERVKEAQSLGAGAYVKKPYVLEKLGLAVKEELDRVT